MKLVRLGNNDASISTIFKIFTDDRDSIDDDLQLLSPLIPFVLAKCLTDGRTDRRTDRQTQRPIELLRRI